MLRLTACARAPKPGTNGLLGGTVPGPGGTDNIMRLLAFLVAAGVILGGCATPPADPASAGDPYEATNRVIFDLNLKIDSATLRPTAERYSTYVPEDVRDS